MGKGSIGEQARSVEYVEFVYSEGPITLQCLCSELDLLKYRTTLVLKTGTTT